MKTFFHKAVTGKLHLLFFLGLFISVFVSASAAAINNSPNPELANTVKNLKLGFGNYTIGSTLTADQVALAQKNLAEEAYQGTFKFKDNDTYVVADITNNMVLAIYQRQENVDREQMKKIIASLMTDFGEPTTMAHDKLVYWAYKKEGKISEDIYNDAKKTGHLDVVATVKMNSTVEIFADGSSQTHGETGDETEIKVPLGTVYTLISSQPLLEGFVKQQE